MDISNLVLTPASEPKKRYSDVLGEYQQDVAGDPDLSKLTVPEYANRMNQITGSNQYDVGTGPDNAVRRFSGNVDLGLKHVFDPEHDFVAKALGAPEGGFNLPEITGQGFKYWAEQAGASKELSDKIEQVGAGMPRTAFDLGMPALVGAATGGVGVLPMMAATTGTSTYGETGSPLKSVITAASTFLFPKASELAGNAALKLVGGKVLADADPVLLQKATALLGADASEVAAAKTEPIVQNLVQGAAKFGGAQVGMFGAGLATEAAQIASDTKTSGRDKLSQLEDMFSPSSLVATGIAQLPFTVMDLTQPHWTPTKNLEGAMLPTWKQQFSDKFSAEMTRLGQPAPSQDQINQVMDRLLNKNPRTPFEPDTATGKALASMNVNPVSLDLKRPVKTTTGDWDMGDAIDSVKGNADRILIARDLPDVKLDEMRIYAAIRASEGSGLSREEIGRNAARRAVETATSDSENLGKVSVSYSGQLSSEADRSMKGLKQNSLDVEIANKVMRTFENGDVNPDYSPDLHRKLALVSGDTDHRIQAGITEPVLMATAGGTKPLDTSIIDMYRGLRDKVENKGANETDYALEVGRRRQAELDLQIDEVEKQSGQKGLFGNSDLEQLKRERALQQDINDQLETGDTTKTGKTKFEQLTADATFAARKAAYQYGKELDLKNPQQVREFVNKVTTSIYRAELGFLREIDTQPYYRDETGNIPSFATREQALSEAARLSSSSDDSVAYTVPRRPRPDVTYPIIENRYFRTLSASPLEAGQIESRPELGQNMSFEGTGHEVFETGIHSEALDALGKGIAQIEKEQVLDAFKTAAELRDPATREARKWAIANNVIDYVAGMPDSKMEMLLKMGIGPDVETGKLPQIREPALRKARFVKFMEFLRDGGDITLKYTKSEGRLKVRGEGDLDGLNRYMGDVGFKRAQKAGDQFHDSTMQGLNFFEQFHLISKHLQAEFANPKAFDPVHIRPKGDFGWVPPGFKDDKEFNLLVQWPKDAAQVVGAKVAGWNVPVDEPKVLMMKDRDGSTVRFESQRPLLDAVIKSTRHNLTMSAGMWHDLFKTYAPHADPFLMSVFQRFTSQSFGKNINMGFGISKDVNVKGRYHYGDDNITSTGIIMSPYNESPTGQHFRQLVDNPEDMLGDVVHEIAHAHTVFVYNHDPQFRAEWDRIYQHVKDKHDMLKETVGLGKFIGDEMYGMTNPEEFMAEVFRDSKLHDFLRNMSDPFGPLPNRPVNVPVTLFDRILDMFKSVFRSVLGPKDGETMLGRVTELASRTTARHEELVSSLGIRNRGDIYQALSQVHVEPKTDLIKGATPPQQVPKTPSTKFSLFESGKPMTPEDASSAASMANWKVAKAELAEVTADIERLQQAITKDPSPDSVNATLLKDRLEKLPQITEIESKLRAQVFGSDEGTTLNVVGQEHPSTTKSAHIVSTAVNREGKLYTGDRWNEMHSVIGEVIHDLGEVPQEQRGFIVQDENGKRRFATRDEAGPIALKAGQVKDASMQNVKSGTTKLQSEDLTDSKGKTLESRVTSNQAQGMVDSLKAASETALEDEQGMWFKPISLQHFQRTFDPVFGGKMVPQEIKGTMGYRISPVALSNMTQKELALMPKPEVRTFAPSAFATFKRLFVQAGETEDNAKALAAYNMQTVAALKGTENTLWGQLPAQKIGRENRILGTAWMPQKIAGIAVPESAENFQRVVTHEATHLAGFTASEVARNWEGTSEIAEAGRQVERMFNKLTPDERKAMIDSLVNISNETRKFADVYTQSYRSPEEFAAEFMGHISEGLTGLPTPNAYLTDMLRFSPDELSNYAIANTQRRYQGLDKLREQLPLMAQERGIPAGKMMDAVETLAKTFKSLARDATEVALDQADFYRMRALYPDMYQSLLLDAVQKMQSGAPLMTREERVMGRGDNYPTGTTLESRRNLFQAVRDHFEHPGDEGVLPKRPSFWMRNIAQFVQLAAQYPTLRPFYDMLASVQGAERIAIIQMQTAGAGAWSGKRLLDDNRTKTIGKFATSQKLRDMFSAMALDMQTEGDSRFRTARGNVESIFDMQPIDFITPEYMDVLYRKYGATVDDRQNLDTIFEGTRNQIKLASAKIVDSQRIALETIAAKAVLKGTELNPEASRNAAKLMSDAIRAQMTGDMETAIAKQQQFAAAVPDVDTQSKVYQILDDGHTRINELERFLSLRTPYYMSERQFGNFGLWWRDDDTNKLLRKYFKSEKDMNNFVTSKQIEPIRQIFPSDRNNFGVSQELFDQLNEFQQKSLEKITDIMGADEAKKLASVLDIATELKQVLSAKNIMSVTTPRKGGSSRDTLDMWDTHNDYVNGIITAAKNRQMRLEADLMLDTPEFANQPVLKRLVEDHIGAVLKPDSKLGNAISQMNFFYFMGYNVSNMILEPFQQISSLAPILTQNGATVKGGYKLIADANKAWLEARTNKGKYRDPEIARMMERAQAEGVVDLGVFSEIDHNQDLSLANRIRRAGGLSQWGTFEMLKNRLYQFTSLARRFYGQVPAYNSEIAFVAAYKHAKAQGLTGEAAYSQARFLKEQAMFGGGKINRPLLFAGVQGASGSERAQIPRSAAQAMWSLQSYSSSMMTMMGNMLKQSFAKGLTPAQSTQVRKAAIQMMGTQLALAGALGLPFAQVGINILQKLFPSENIELQVRHMLAQIEGDDQALGGWLTSAVTTGVPSAFSNAPDMGSRFAVSGTMGVSPYSGISLDNVIGPTASIIRNVFKGIQAGVRGDAPAAVEQLMPRGLQRIWKTLEEGNTFQSNQGDVLVNDFSPAERAGRLLGFTPARVTRLREAQNLDRVSKDAAKNENASWVDQQAGDVISGKDINVATAISNRAKSHKSERIDLTRAIANRVMEKTTPIDTRKFGNQQTLDEQRKLMTVAGPQTSRVSGAQRLQMQANIARRLGVPAASPSAGTIRRTNMTDYLLNLYPSLSLPQASSIVSHQSTPDQFLE